MQNWGNIFQEQSDVQIKHGLCASACANYCFTHPNADPADWKDIENPIYREVPIDTCNKIFG
ncbi:MAG: hypothetical protein V3U72_01110, partial [Candidatus Aenigmarchaeota archaeon]